MQIELTYPSQSEPRYGHGKPPHPQLYRILNAGRKAYKKRLAEFRAVAHDLADVPLNQSDESLLQPFWLNRYFEGFDAFSLHGFLATEKPRTYVEIGSGNSTKFALNAIRKRGLATKIISIDPEPRAAIDAICSQVIRERLETVDLGIFEKVPPGSIVFFDGSHHCLMGSDVTVFFLEIIPRLPRGVLIHVHDIFLPDDYPPEWISRYYSEQYLLAAMLLGGFKDLRVELPVYFVVKDPELASSVAPLWSKLPQGVQLHGGSFWMRRT